MIDITTLKQQHHQQHQPRMSGGEDGTQLEVCQTIRLRLRLRLPNDEILLAAISAEREPMENDQEETVAAECQVRKKGLATNSKTQTTNTHSHATQKCNSLAHKQTRTHTHT